MKKLVYTLIASGAIFALALSCTKEITPDIDNQANAKAANSSIPTEIIAVINPDDAATKTQYAGNTTFGWTSGDQVRMPVAKWSGANQTGSITACDYYTFNTTDASGSASATFIINGGTADMEGYNPNPYGAASTWTSMGYLVYPHALFNKTYSGSKPKITLPASIAYNESTPLDGGVVPLIGRKDGDTYKFSTAVGFIKLTVSNAPSDANKIQLVSAANALAGDFVPDDVDATVSQLSQSSVVSGTSTLTLTGLSLTAGESYDFYFPVPVGTYAANDLSVTLFDSNNVPLLEKTIAKSLTIARNEVLAIPALLYHRVYVKGSLSNPLLYTENPYASSGTIRMIVSRNKLTKNNYNKAEWPSGNRFAANQNGWALNSHADFLKNVTESGLFYLQYIVCTDGTQPSALNENRVAIYGSVPFYFVPSANKIPVEESWLNVPYVSTSEGSVANLVNGTTAYWHSPYGSENPSRNATYGQIISVDLNEGSLTTKGDFYFSFLTRKGALNDHSKSINVYVSNVRWDDDSFGDGKVLVGSTSNALEGIYPYDGVWIKTPIECTHMNDNDYRYITISILSNSTGNDLRTSGCTHMAEIEFYTK